VDAHAAQQSSERWRLSLVAPILAFAAAALIGFGTHTLVRSALKLDTVPVAPAPAVPAVDQKHPGERGTASPARQVGDLQQSTAWDSHAVPLRAILLNDLVWRA
jgi:hypothetical protein